MPPFWEVKVCEVEDLRRGDQAAVARGVYVHHMIVTDDPVNLRKVSVIHYTNDFLLGAIGILSGSGKSGFPIATVRKGVEDISADVRNGKVYRIDYSPLYYFSPDEIVERAESKLGEGEYSPFTNNCEHFATWCKTGSHESSQAEVATQVVKAVASDYATFVVLRYCGTNINVVGGMVGAMAGKAAVQLGGC